MNRSVVAHRIHGFRRYDVMSRIPEGEETYPIVKAERDRAKETFYDVTVAVDWGDRERTRLWRKMLYTDIEI